eukprot:6201042-Pleurochrysis_carterae.AAC.2
MVVTGATLFSVPSDISSEFSHGDFERKTSKHNLALDVLIKLDYFCRAVPRWRATNGPGRGVPALRAYTKDAPSKKRGRVRRGIPYSLLSYILDRQTMSGWRMVLELEAPF